MSQPDATPPSPADPPAPSRVQSRGPLIVLIVITLLGCAGVVYNAFNSETQETLDTASHDIAAGACATAFKALTAFPLLDSADRIKRADLLERENAVYDTMISTMATATPPAGDGADAYRLWVEDWKSVNQSRRNYAKALRASSEPPELLLAKDGSAPITNRMNQYSRTHDLVGCATHNLSTEIVDGIRNFPDDPTKVP